MALTAEYEIVCEALPLVEVSGLATDATLEIELQYNHGDPALFIVYVMHTDESTIESAFESAAFVAKHTLIGRAGDTYQYKISPAATEEAQLGDHIDLSELRLLATTEAIIDRIRVTPTGWIQTGWFADRESFDKFRRFWQRNGEFKLR